MTVGERLGGSPRLGYALSLCVNFTALWILNVSPGWQALEFLTPAAEDVMGLLNLSLVVALLCNGVLLIFRSTLLRGLRDALIATLGLAVLARTFVVFPFAAADDTAARIALKAALGVAMAATFLAVVSGWSLVARALAVLARPEGETRGTDNPQDT
jgi:hypothetical protein